jgi:putative transposase
MGMSFKYRIYPNESQKILLAKTFGCIRYFWNQQVETFNSYNKETNPNPKYLTSTEMRNKIEWMKEVSAGALAQRERDFWEYKNQRFSKSRKIKISNPKFKSKKDKQSYRLQDRKFAIRGDKIRLEKIGLIKIVIDREIPTDARQISATISMNPCKQYFVSIYTDHSPAHLNKTNKSVGIDVGLKSFLTQSDELIIVNPRYFRKSQVKLSKIQKLNKRKVKGSSRFVKAKIKIARLYNKTTNQKEWFLHNESMRIVKNYDLICVEDLNISGMLKNRKVSKSIMDASWSKFFFMLKYKSDWYGKELVEIPRFYPSSKTCCFCGNIKNDITLNDRVYCCNKCGSTIDRDLNASKNINAIGVNIAKRA